MEIMFRRNAKFWGIQYTDEFIEIHKKQTKILNKILKIMRKEIKKGDIIHVDKFYVTYKDGEKITNAKYKDKLQHVFGEDAVNETAKRNLVIYVLEKYSGYFRRNGNAKLPSIRVKGKSYYVKDRNITINIQDKTITIPTVYGDQTLKYKYSLKEDLLGNQKFGGNLIIRQNALVVAVQVPFKMAYQPQSYLGFDLNKTADDWIVLNNGSRISAPPHIIESFKAIRDLNTDLDKDKKLPVPKRQHRTKYRTKIRRQWEEAHRKLRSQVRKVAVKIINEAIENKALLCIDSVKTGQRMGTFGQDHLIPLLQTMCENQGIPFYVVPCKDTSKRCNECGNIDAANRVSTEEFICTNQDCFSILNAQVNAAKNVAYYGERLLTGNVPFGNYTKKNMDKLLTEYKDKYEVLFNQ